MKELENALAEARQPLLDAIAQTFSLYGWPEVAGHIYGLLHLEDDPLSLDEIGEYLAVSKATVSTHLRTLENLHIVQRVRGPHMGESSSGRPRAYFDAEMNLIKVIRELLHHNARREMDMMTRGVNESRTRLQTLSLSLTDEPEILSDVESDLASLDGFEDYMRWGRRLLWLSQNSERMQHFVDAFQGDERREQAWVAELEAVI